MEFITMISPQILQAGGAVTAAIFLVAIYSQIRKVTVSNNSETALYATMSKEILRLSAALTEADNQIAIVRKSNALEIKAIRDECTRERAKSEKQIRDLGNQVRFLTEKLISND